MKITRSDSEHLIIVDFPIFSAIWFFFFVVIGVHLLISTITKSALNPGILLVGCIFLTIGVVAQFWLLNRSVFDFDLRSQMVAWKRTGLLGRGGGAITFKQIKYVYLEYSSGKGGFNYRPVLQLGSKVVPLRPYFTHDTDSQKICNEINKALGKSPRSMEEDMEVTVRSLVSCGESDAAVRIVRRFFRYNFAQADEYIKSLK